LLIMMRKAILPTILAALIILGLTQPVSAPINPDISVEPREINAYVCSRFSVEIWITNLPGPMTWFNFTILWDPNLMELVDRENYAVGRGWEYLESLGDGRYSAEAKRYQGSWSVNAAWAKLTFHCLGEGTSEIFFSYAKIFIVEEYIVPDPFTCTVHQTARAVGGVLATANKLAVLSPYLALIGLVGAVTAAVAIRKREA